MSNNRGNNRRRGRGGNRNQGSNPVNRIDSRARGNAPQLLEKYRKLAQDAALNGDRVQAEYYLQFADHYFRVIADARAQKEEQRPRHAEREPSRYGEDEDFDEGDDFRSSPQPQFQPQPSQRQRQDEEAVEELPGERGSEGDEIDPEDNPFTRESRGRGRPQRNARRREPRGQEGGSGAEAGEAGEVGLDPAILPPSIARTEEPAGDAGEDQPRPRRRSAPRKRKTDGEGEALETVA